MKIEKLKFISQKTSTAIFVAIFFAFPFISSASTLPMGTSMGIDNAKQFLELLRTQIKFNLPTQDAAAAALQGQLEQNISGALSNLGGLGKQLETAASLINMGSSINKGNFATVIPQLLSQAGQLQNLTGIANIGAITNQIQGLAGKVPGLSESMGTINKNLANLSNVNSVVNNLGTKLNNVTSVAGNMQSTLQTAASRTAGGILQPSSNSGLNADGLTAAEAERYASYEDYWNGLEASWNETDGALAGAASGADLNNLASNFGNAGAKGQEQTVCKPNSAANRGSGSGNGVPTIEQEGALLDFTGQLVNYTAKIKAINEETCKLIEQLYKKEFELDPKIKEEAQKAIAETKKQLEKQFNEGRKPSNDLNAKKSFAPTPAEYVKEETDAARTKHLDLLKNSGIPDEIRKPLEEVFKMQNEIDKSDDASYAKRVAPTFDTKSFLQKSKEVSNAEYFSGLTQIANPKNNLFGQILIQSAERQRMEEAAEKNARDELIAGQGIIGLKQCLRTSEDGKNCLEWQVATPAKTFGDLQSAYYTDNYKQTAEANDISAKTSIPASSQDVQIISAASGASAGSGPTGNGSTLPPTQGGTTNPPTNGGGSGFDLNDLIDQIINGGENQEGEGEPIVTLPLPIIDISLSPETPVNAVGITRLNWSADLASSCKASNNWIWFSDKATTTSEILVRAETDRSFDGNIPIYHPSAFSFSASVSGNSRVINIPQSYTLTIVKEGTGLKQTIRYEPNITPELFENDVFQIKINNDLENEPIISLLFREDMTRSEMVDEIINAMNITPATSDAGKIYRSITKEKSTDGNALILTRSVPNVPAGAEYELTCENLSGQETKKKVTLEFFR